MANFDQFDLRALLLKIEGTEGTDAAPIPSADTLQIINGSGSLSTEQLEREIDRPFFGGREAIRINKRMEWAGDIELVGAASSGTAAPISTVLQICGHAETLDVATPGDEFTDYNPISTGIPSATAWWYQGGEVQKGVGSRAQLNQILLELNNFPRASVQGVAFPTENSEAALPTTDTSAFQKPPAIITDTAACTIDGTTVDGLSLELNMNANVPLIATTERQITRLTARNPQGVIRIFREDRATINIRNIIETAALVPIVWTVDSNSVGGERITLTMGQCQLFDPEFTEEEGLLVWNVPFRAIPSATGNDEYLLRFDKSDAV